MAIKRYKADSDNTIVNAFRPDLSTRGTGANAGMADIVETFSIYGRYNTSSQELSRVLVKFPVSSISTDRSNSAIPASGSVSFYLRMFNAPHSKTVPKDYKLVVAAVSQSWQEGVGLDLEGYKDVTSGNSGSNWIYANNATQWTNVGGDYLTSSDYFYQQSFEDGLADLEVDITSLVERWLASDVGNYGVGVHLTSSNEAHFSSSTGANSGSLINNPSGATVSYYTKRFFARGSQYFFKRPVLEARWKSAKQDDRALFYYSSSLAPAADNLNTIYFYNFVRGRLVNIPSVGTSAILVSLYSGSKDNTTPSGSKLSLYDSNTNMTGGYVSTGVYSCSIGIASSSTTALFDVWHSGSTQYFTGSITPKLITGYGDMSSTKPVYYLNITNLQGKYTNRETARFNLYVRDKNWSPNIYTVANATIPTTPIVSASYRVYRIIDALEAVAYGTGSDFQTGLSYDSTGNYFDFDMSLLEPGYAYAFKFTFYDQQLNSWIEQDEAFKFRVESYEY